MLCWLWFRLLSLGKEPRAHTLNTQPHTHIPRLSFHGQWATWLSRRCLLEFHGPLGSVHSRERCSIVSFLEKWPTARLIHLFSVGLLDGGEHPGSISQEGWRRSFSASECCQAMNENIQFQCVERAELARLLQLANLGSSALGSSHYISHLC